MFLNKSLKNFWIFSKVDRVPGSVLGAGVDVSVGGIVVAVGVRVFVAVAVGVIVDVAVGNGGR